VQQQLRAGGLSRSANATAFARAAPACGRKLRRAHHPRGSGQLLAAHVLRRAVSRSQRNSQHRAQRAIAIHLRKHPKSLRRQPDCLHIGQAAAHLLVESRLDGLQSPRKLLQIPRPGAPSASLSAFHTPRPRLAAPGPPPPAPPPSPRSSSKVASRYWIYRAGQQPHRLAAAQHARQPVHLAGQEALALLL